MLDAGRPDVPIPSGLAVRPALTVTSGTMGGVRAALGGGLVRAAMAVVVRVATGTVPVGGAGIVSLDPSAHTLPDPVLTGLESRLAGRHLSHHLLTEGLRVALRAALAV